MMMERYKQMDSAERISMFKFQSSVRRALFADVHEQLRRWESKGTDVKIEETLSEALQSLSATVHTVSLLKQVIKEAEDATAVSADAAVHEENKNKEDTSVNENDEEEPEVEGQGNDDVVGSSTA